ncbi:hypothetical protein [Lacticaseibacillus absianus]|nr:hypothetical protein [Lacticaseibacillus absianus]
MAVFVGPDFAVLLIGTVVYTIELGGVDSIECGSAEHAETVFIKQILA